MIALALVNIGSVLLIHRRSAQIGMMCRHTDGFLEKLHLGSLSREVNSIRAVMLQSQRLNIGQDLARISSAQMCPLLEE